MGLPLLTGCCGFRLATGAAAISVVLIISGIVSIVFVATGIEAVYFREMLMGASNFSESQANVGACIYASCYGLMSVASLIMASILLHGIRKDRLDLMKAYLVWAVVEISLVFLALFVTLILCREAVGFTELISSLAVIHICIEAYLMWVIHSYRITLKTEQGLRKTRLEDIE